MARYRRPTLGIAGRIRGALRTYNSLLYAGRATADSAKKLKTWYQNRKKAPINPVVAKIRQRTRGELASHPTAFSRKSISGQQRRDSLAKNIRAYRAKYPTQRTHNATKSPGAKLTRAPRTTKISLESGITANRVHSRIRRYKMRDSYVNPILNSHRGDRKAAAAEIRSNRKSGIRPKFKTNKYDPLFKKAANYIRSKGIKLAP